MSTTYRTPAQWVEFAARTELLDDPLIDEHISAVALARFAELVRKETLDEASDVVRELRSAIRGD